MYFSNSLASFRLKKCVTKNHSMIIVVQIVNRELSLCTKLGRGKEENRYLVIITTVLIVFILPNYHLFLDSWKEK